jgi:protoporphyrinogen oxidase
MDSVRYLVVGAGVTGLSFANWIGAETDLLILEADAEPGGYCKTVARGGFVWDYSGHFFHFRHPEIERWLRDRMGDQEIRTVVKRSNIYFAGDYVDFPFQKNIHQLPREDFIDCLVSLYFRTPSGRTAPESAATFKEMVVQRYGRGIADRFLIPYNEKLYATDLDNLDAGAMGRFFPHADLDAIIRNMRAAPGGDDASYNATFTYPLGGAIEYIKALLVDLPDGAVSYGERLVGVDLDRKIARTNRREIGFETLVSSAPLPALLEACGVEVEPGTFTWNKVLIFNLGFDRKGAGGVHWTYYPQRDLCFYRVGYYDNIMGSDRMSLYVEIGAGRDAELDVDASRERALADLERAGVVGDHQLVAWHSVVLDPAYVHINRRSTAAVARAREQLGRSGVHTAGRYGGWTYCSIEDNIVEARALAKKLVDSNK